MNLQFYHGTINKNHYKEFTVVVDVPKKEDLRLEVWALLGDVRKTLSLSVGLTRVNPKDQYNKKIGRVEATKTCRARDFTLTEVLIRGNGSKVLYLHSEDIQITLEMQTGRDKVHLIEARI